MTSTQIAERLAIQIGWNYGGSGKWSMIGYVTNRCPVDHENLNHAFKNMPKEVSSIVIERIDDNWHVKINSQEGISGGYPSRSGKAKKLVDAVWYSIAKWNGWIQGNE